jgi:hypothetical protein
LRSIAFFASRPDSKQTSLTEVVPLLSLPPPFRTQPATLLFSLGFIKRSVESPPILLPRTGIDENHKTADDDLCGLEKRAKPIPYIPDTAPYFDS